MTLPLACAAGATDAMSYLSLGHVFTANMSGNIVLLGIAISTGRLQQMLPHMLPLLSFAIGVVAGGFIAEDASDSIIWPARTTAPFAVEGFILTGIAVAWLIIGSHPAGPVRFALTGCTAFSLGMQSATMRRLKVTGIVTTYITGTLTTLVMSIEKPIKQKAGPSERTPSGRTDFAAVAGIGAVSRVGCRNRSGARPLGTRHRGHTRLDGAVCSGVLLVAEEDLKT